MTVITRPDLGHHYTEYADELVAAPMGSDDSTPAPAAPTTDEEAVNGGWYAPEDLPQTTQQELLEAIRG